MKAGRVPDQSDVPVAWSAEHVLCSALLYVSGFKAKFGYDSRIGLSPCDRDPLAWICFQAELRRWARNGHGGERGTVLGSILAPFQFR